MIRTNWMLFYKKGAKVGHDAYSLAIDHEAGRLTGTVPNLSTYLEVI